MSTRHGRDVGLVDEEVTLLADVLEGVLGEALELRAEARAGDVEHVGDRPLGLTGAVRHELAVREQAVAVDLTT